jgi:hypothetical protein
MFAHATSEAVSIFDVTANRFVPYKNGVVVQQ